jgi:Fur family ferric uptake transcriptional regulator
MTINAITNQLRRSGYKLTPQRLAVITVISSTHDHLTPSAIYERVKQEYPTIGLVTIYRVLDVLTKIDLLCRVHAEDNCRSYLMRRPVGHHHHIICSDCGKVADFSDCNLDKLQEIISRATGFKIKGHLLEFDGLCRECSHKREPLKNT